MAREKPKGRQVMIDNSDYIASGFKATVRERFAHDADRLSAEFDKRLAELLRENADASEEKMLHLKSQILPGIAAYEALQTVMPRDEALEVIHGYTERHALKAREIYDKLMRVPGLYRAVPWMFAKLSAKLFGERAGFTAKEHQITGGVWRIDMLKCPYFDTCRQYNCAELCSCFCDSDDVSYSNLHKNLLWKRTKTLGKGGDCCDFCLMLKSKAKDKA